VTSQSSIVQDLHETGQVKQILSACSGEGSPRTSADELPARTLHGEHACVYDFAMRAPSCRSRAPTEIGTSISAWTVSRATLTKASPALSAGLSYMTDVALRSPTTLFAIRELEGVARTYFAHTVAFEYS
jgi:hypothetical protein